MSPEDAAIVSQWTGARPRPQHGPLAPEATQRTPPATAQRRIAALVCVALVVLLAAVASATTRTAASALYYARSHAAAQGSVALPMGTSPQTTPRTRAEGVHRPPHRIRAAEAGGGPVPPEAPHGPGRPSPATAFGPGPPRATALGLAALVCVLPAAALLRVARARLLRKPGPARVALLTASGAAPPGPEASAPAPAPPQPPLAPEAPCQALQERHPHPRDKTIRFDPADHKYFYQAAPDAWRTASVSVTELVGACFPEFDEEFKIAQMMSRKKWPPVQYTHADGSAFTKEEVACAWHQKRDEAATLGTWMHAEIEKELNGLPPQDAPELRHFRQFEAEVLRPRGIRPFRTEMVVYDEDLDIAGSIDLLAVDDRGVFYICDWKRKADFATKIRTVYRGESGARWPLEHLPNTDAAKYSLQLNMYCRILQRRYQARVGQLWLGVFHPDQTGAVAAQVPFLDAEVDCLFALRRLEVAAARRSGRAPTPGFTHARQALADEGDPLVQAFAERRRALCARAKSAAFYAAMDQDTRYKMHCAGAEGLLRVTDAWE